MKKLAIMVIVFSLALVLSACGGKSAGSSSKGDGDVYVLELGTSLGEGDPIYDGMVEFSENIKEKTNGEVEIVIHGNDSLGEINDLIEQAKEGANVAVLTDSGRLADFVPEMGVLTGPYIIGNYDEAKKVVQSELFEDWNSELQEKDNLDILSFNWYQGDRHFITKKPVETPDDLKGMKIRTIDSPVATKTITSLGASPSGEAFSEVYSAIQQGVIDGAEAQYPALWSQKTHEVAPHVAKTSHFQLISGIVASKTWLDNLPEEYQEIIHEEAFEAGDTASGNTEESLVDFEDQMKENGAEIHEVDPTLFEEKTDEVYDQIEGYQELKEQINKILNE